MNDLTIPRRSNLFIILVLGALSTITPFAIDMYLPAFEQIAKDLNTTPAKVSLSLSSYFVGFALGQVFYGPLLDRYGRKKPLCAGLALFILASIGCLLAQSVPQLAVLRFIQALGACVAAVASTAMVRDFFPVKESAKVFSLLMLVLSVSPLFAPTVGSVVTVAFGWHAVFLILAGIGVAMLGMVYFYLPEAHVPDTTISLHPLNIIAGFTHVITQPQFYTYTFAGAFSFAGLLVYVAGSPIIFMEQFHVSAQTYGAIFALLAAGFIGANQLNILLLKRYSSAQIFMAALMLQVLAAGVFLALNLTVGTGLVGTFLCIFSVLACLGMTVPNSAALALAPFHRNVGSASALIGFIRIGLSAAASSCIGIFNSVGILPIVLVLFTTALIGLVVLMIGKRHIGALAEGPIASEVILAEHSA